ncbi:MAG: CDP-diacylglycerol--glycerol-3-phosphate 3-phosphatidyltransferase [Burkholderiales bacterium]|jgi:CDP-diacylglycerol--glycerol-3-phosphate 3-phosphatidyltransferase/cardiolipin synthase|nr:CDP-diacylglycerol--glycerol-3-phosphate 3-phosphatidyltransferase [Burkholderiales bacterium]MCA3153665.1 CDP-diacylglycerol--glycerol-3-phosphate 3-phosphatidyltransferase [Burkholderiales bacterium]MCA3156396.1 CDP-diacylglycerol--glycerol-3-phosphate 3-phosphatidyltransferase [Burkholderiales bacterium]MCA3159718.1 CDP-diacylglycerol--glycerol-3-phosphate 3-phosphatidyltransferase [Burkholderiales bacterium]MCA3160636.1 CDP-diacylglycerol--glycerol-3-phosphate 3-phosphatidyltransferase [
MPFNLPIFLTWLRILAIPLLALLFHWPFAALSVQERNLIATVLFVGAALTDWLDGYLARKWNQVSSFGAFLDPVADKLMVAAALLMLLKEQRVDTLVALIIIGREITISALREWMAQIGATRAVAVNMLGKIKTVAQMVAIPLLLYQAPIGALNVMWLGTLLIWIAAVLTVISMLYYLRKAWPAIAERTGSG